MRGFGRFLLASAFFAGCHTFAAQPGPAVQTWRISFELAFGDSSPYAQRIKPSLYDVPYLTSFRVTSNALPQIAEKARIMAGLQQVDLYFGPGGYEKYVSPSAQMVVKGTAGQVRLACCLIGYLAQQTEVIASTEDPSGDVPALDVLGFSSTSPSAIKQVHADWLKINSKSPKLVGFLPLAGKDGGIRIIDAGKSWSGRDVASFDGLISAAMKRRSGIRTRRTLVRLISSKNEWAKSPAGEAYLAQLRALGRSDLAEKAVKLNGEVSAMVKRAYLRYMPGTRGSSG